MSAKLNYKQKQFLGTCKTCGHYLKYIPDISYLVCSNEHCPGMKVRKKGYVMRRPVIRKLDSKGIEIANKLFQNTRKEKIDECH